MSRLRLAISFSMALVMAGVGRAAYLESDFGGTPTPRPTDPPHRIAPPHHGDNPIQRLAHRVTIGAPAFHRGLWIYPLQASDQWDGTRCSTLDEALRHRWLEVGESENAAAGELRVRNTSDRHIFLMSGETIAGGKQNRIIRQSVLLPPRSGNIRIPVYCGEKGRWTERPETFSSTGILSDPLLRSKAARAESQGQIWGAIEDRMEAASVPSRTQDYKAIFEEAGIERRVDEYASELRRCLTPTTVGMVAVAGNRILGGDLFGNAQLLSRFWDKLCRSYALAPMLEHGRGWRERRWRQEAPTRHVEVFVQRLVVARYTPSRTPGSGQRFQIQHHIEGEALAWRDMTVHASFFSVHTIQPIARQPQQGETS